MRLTSIKMKTLLIIMPMLLIVMIALSGISYYYSRQLIETELSQRIEMQMQATLAGFHTKLVNHKTIPETLARIAEKGGQYVLKTKIPGSIGRVRSFAGNVGVAIKAYAYLRGHDASSLRSIAENAILNANYARTKLNDLFPSAVDEPCMHECVLKTEPEKLNGLKTLDVAKRLLDFGCYAPTIYFPLIVHEAIMIEPTETETKETLDAFVAILRAIHAEALSDPARVHAAPHALPVKRLDELAAARVPDVAWA